MQVTDSFRYGPEAFGRLPFWAHLLPCALAQFHTIVAMIVFLEGLQETLGLCHGSASQFELLWWEEPQCT